MSVKLARVRGRRYICWNCPARISQRLDFGDEPIRVEIFEGLEFKGEAHGIRGYRYTRRGGPLPAHHNIDVHDYAARVARPPVVLECPDCGEFSRIDAELLDRP